MFYSLSSTLQEAEKKAPAAALPFPAGYQDGLALLSPADYRLTFEGCFVHPQTFTDRELMALPQVSVERRVVSAEGWSFKGTWTGVKLADIFQKLEPQLIARYLVQENASGHKESLPLEQFLASQPMLCHSVNGKRLPALYGGPWRVMVFDRYLYKGLTQVTRMELTVDDLVTTFWEDKGLDRSGTIAPGDYYAFDLSAFRPLRGPESLN